jgi:hypothetical protein
MLKSVFGATTALTSVTAAGVFTVSVTPVQVPVGIGSVIGSRWNIEKVGRFVAMSVPAVNIGNVPEGSWIQITATLAPTIQPQNQGLFRVVRSEASTVNPLNFGYSTVWIENANAIEEQNICDVHFYSFDSVMPGDTVHIDGNNWGSGNVGDWTVISAAAQSFTVDTSKKSPITHGVASALGIDSRLFTVSEADPTRLFKRVVSITPDSADASVSDIRFDTAAGYALISEAAGSVLTVLDKLDFPIDVFVGVDGYRDTVGLIGEANKVLYGVRNDPSTYPGIISAGSNVNISGPLVRRITAALVLRVQTGVSLQDIEDSVRSAVASVVNASGVGQSIAISSLIDAASEVTGVISVVVTYPVYGAGNDLIPVAPYEKAMVLDLNNDITITFTGDQQ